MFLFYFTIFRIRSDSCLALSGNIGSCCAYYTLTDSMEMFSANILVHRSGLTMLLLLSNVAYNYVAYMVL